MNESGQFCQIFSPECGTAPCDCDEGIQPDDIRPTGRQCNQLIVRVVEIDPILTPRALVGDQLERLAAQGVKGMRDVKDSCRNVG